MLVWEAIPLPFGPSIHLPEAGSNLDKTPAHLSYIITNIHMQGQFTHIHMLGLWEEPNVTTETIKTWGGMHTPHAKDPRYYMAIYCFCHNRCGCVRTPCPSVLLAPYLLACSPVWDSVTHSSGLDAWACVELVGHSDWKYINCFVLFATLFSFHFSPLCYF